ncbi:MAG TPA: hypothetical protein VKT73_05295 [Xanthobacteraceae bacterium]|nr:hypothetical protein [Xanthobacteraceae bacterium]
MRTRKIPAIILLCAIEIFADPVHATNRRQLRQNPAAAETQPAAFPFFNPFVYAAANGNNAGVFNAFGGGAKPAYAGGPGGRPRAWCGWWARQQVGQDPGPEFNLVASWRKWGTPTGPVPGAVAIWRGARHVGKVVSIDGGEVCTVSGNSGGGGVNSRCEPLSHFEQFRM